MTNDTLSQRTQVEMSQLFAMPVFRFFWPDSEALNQELRATILKRMEESRGVVRSNRGGWHSDGNLQTWPEECVKVFMDGLQSAIHEIVRQTIPDPSPEHFAHWQITVWANVNKKGAFNKAHHHDGAGNLWSGFYYVDTGQTNPHDSVGGRTVLQDRSGVPKETLRNQNPFAREVCITPTAGLMVLFPGRLYHHVEPYEGDRVRITIAFNLKHAGFLIPYYEGMQELNWWWTNFRGLMIIPRKVPEKFLALANFASILKAYPAPTPFRLRAYLEHLRWAFDQATAEATARAEQNWGRVTPEKSS